MTKHEIEIIEGIVEHDNDTISYHGPSLIINDIHIEDIFADYQGENIRIHIQVIEKKEDEK